MRSEDPRCGLRCPGLDINSVMAAPTNRREHPTSKQASCPICIPYDGGRWGGGGEREGIVTARPGLECGKIGAKKWDVGNPENSGMWDFQNIFRVSFIMNNFTS